MSEVLRPTTTAALPGGQVEYRLERRGDGVVLVFHGGHTRAGLAMGEDVFAAAGCTVLAPSRPGYGRTPLATGASVQGFTDVVRGLCGELGIDRVAAVVGISGGGPTAATMAALHGDLVERLILISAVGWLPYPARWTRFGSYVGFAHGVEGVTWAAVRAFIRLSPNASLRMMVKGLSTRPPDEVIGALSSEDKAALLTLFSHMRSGRGFLNDFHPTPDITAQIGRPTLVIATRTDRGVPFAQAESLTRSIPHAELVESTAHSHMVWFGDDWPRIAQRIRTFLASAPSPGQLPSP